MAEFEPQRLALNKGENAPISAVAAKRKREELEQQEREENGSESSELEEVLDGPIEGAPTAIINEPGDKKPLSRKQQKRQAKKERLQKKADAKAKHQKNLARRRELKSAKLEKEWLRLETIAGKRRLRTLKRAEAGHAAVTGPGNINSLGTKAAPSFCLKYTSFPFDSDMIVSDNGGTMAFRIETGHRLLIMGEYYIQVHDGLFTVMGALLRPGIKMYLVYAPLSHAIPDIKCLAGAAAEASGGPNITISRSEKGISLLHRVSPLFKHLWVKQPATSSDDRRSFALLHSQQDLPEQSRYRAKSLALPMQWRDSISLLTEHARKSLSPPIVVIAGPKSAGKSTFCRVLINSIITNLVPKRSVERGGLAFLDLDPGQPEFSAPCQVSLYRLEDPIFGPPFTHPTVDESAGNRQLRSHHIGFASPKDNPGHYLACVADLTAHYHNLLLADPVCPLIINTAGWTRGVGMDLLLGILDQTRADRIIWISPLDPDPDLYDLKRFLNRTTVHELPSSWARKISQSESDSLISGDLRAMQTLSYFHHTSELAIRVQSGSPNLRWDVTPLTHRKPWVVQYSGPNRGILGIAVLGETLWSDWLPIAINGTIVAIVIIEDESAITVGLDDTHMTNGTAHGDDGDEGEPKPEQESNPFGIQYGPQFKIPYLPLLNGEPLDPTKTRCVGLAIVRGIDFKNSSLHLLANVDPGKLPSGRHIVLVRGRAELPVSAYVEANPSVFGEKVPLGSEGRVDLKRPEIPYVAFSKANKTKRAPGIRRKNDGLTMMQV